MCKVFQRDVELRYVCYSRQKAHSLGHLTDERVVSGTNTAFTDSENADLSTLLKDMQEKIILPGRLPPKQRKLIFDPSKRAFLEQNPIVIEVDGADHRFTSLDSHKDIPRSRTVLFSAVEKMKTQQDWDKLSSILSGYKKAGIKLKQDELSKIVRVACREGYVSSIIECAKQAERTGLYIADREKLGYIFQALCTKIAEVMAAGVEGPASVAKIEQAVKRAEQVLDVIQRPLHMDHNKHTGPVRNDLHYSLVARGMFLYARAALAQAKQKAGQAATAELTQLQDEVRVLRSLWEPFEGKDVSAVREFAHLNAENDPKFAMSPPLYSRSICWTIKAVELAKNLSIAEAADLSPVTSALESHLGALAKSSKKATFAETYESVVGRKPTW